MEECWICRMSGERKEGKRRELGVGDGSFSIALCTVHAFDIEMLAAEACEAVPLPIDEEVSICIRNLQVYP
jgi:hypothetical protein